MLPPTQPKFKHCDFAPVSVVELNRLDMETLMQFELIQDQYRALGVCFEGAIALQPSNPAFSAPSGSMVLMPTASKPHIIANFLHPVQRIGAMVSGARQIRLTAFDRHGNVLMHQCTDRPRSLQLAEENRAFPRHVLEVNAAGIARVVFASDSPFLLDDFFFF